MTAETQESLTVYVQDQQSLPGDIAMSKSPVDLSRYKNAHHVRYLNYRSYHKIYQALGRIQSAIQYRFLRRAYLCTKHTPRFELASVAPFDLKTRDDEGENGAITDEQRHRRYQGAMHAVQSTDLRGNVERVDL